MYYTILRKKVRFVRERLAVTFFLFFSGRNGFHSPQLIEWKRTAWTWDIARPFFTEARVVLKYCSWYKMLLINPHLILGMTVHKPKNHSAWQYFSIHVVCIFYQLFRIGNGDASLSISNPNCIKIWRHVLMLSLIQVRNDMRVNKLSTLTSVVSC